MTFGAKKLGNIDDDDEWLDVRTQNSTTPAKRISRVKCLLSLPVLVIEGDGTFSWSSGGREEFSVLVS